MTRYAPVRAQTGVTMVGTSSFLGGSSSATQDISPEQNLCGMALIVISQAVQAAQLTFEDFFMADLDIAPMKVRLGEGRQGGGQTRANNRDRWE